jgi:hypothetical protein
VVTDDGNRRFELEVVEADADLLIDGPALLTAGEAATLTLTDGNGLPIVDDDATWTVGQNQYRQASVDVVPAESGVLSVEVATVDGRRVSRTFTIGPGR